MSSPLPDMSSSPSSSNGRGRGWTRRRAAWAVPVATAAAVGVGVGVPLVASGSTHPNLPSRTAAQLLVAVQKAPVPALSGTVVETARLGLPELPGAADSASLSWQSLITGSHTARVWLNGPDQQRIAVVGQLSESDLVRNGRDVWTYTSQTAEVTHDVLPNDVTKHATPPAVTASPSDLTPQAAAEKALAAIDPTTKVDVDRTAEVAGRSAYQIVLHPRDARSTVKKVKIALDSATSVPLRVQIYGSAARPAIEVGFTDVTFKAPDASVFRFHAPAGATITKGPLSSLNGAPRERAKAKLSEAPAHEAGKPSTRVIGQGWTSILEIRGAGAPGAMGAMGADAGLVQRLLTRVDAGQELRTTLVNALITHDGRIYLGAVSPSMLEAAAR